MPAARLSTQQLCCHGHVVLTQTHLTEASPCTDLRAGEHTSEALAPGLRLAEEGGGAEERSGTEGQHVGQAHLQQSAGDHGGRCHDNAPPHRALHDMHSQSWRGVTLNQTAASVNLKPRRPNVPLLCKSPTLPQMVDVSGCKCVFHNHH